jgi:hypothetical protein
MRARRQAPRNPPTPHNAFRSAASSTSSPAAPAIHPGISSSWGCDRIDRPGRKDAKRLSALGWRPCFKRCLLSLAGRLRKAVARRERLLGVACLFLSIIILLPIPLANFLPAVYLAAIAFGMLQRDGAVIALGLTATAAFTGILLYICNFPG